MRAIFFRRVYTPEQLAKAIADCEAAIKAEGGQPVRNTDDRVVIVSRLKARGHTERGR